MTKKLFAGLALMLLLSAFSNTKASAQSSEKLNVSDESAKVILNGTFTLYWSWSCGAYSKTSFYIYSDGTFVDGYGETGKWIKNNTIFQFQFDAGNLSNWTGVIGKTTIDGLALDYLVDPDTKGCFQLVKGSVREKNEINGGETRTPSGRLIK